MTERAPRIHCLVATAIFAGALSADLAFAGGALEFDVAGHPVAWSTASPIEYKTDLGGLGGLDNGQANQVVANAFASWQGVSTAAIAYQRVGPLGEDVHGPTVSPPTVGNYGPYLGPYADPPMPPRGENVVVFDADGSIFDELFGTGTGILGFAGPTFFAVGSTTSAVGAPVPAGAHIVEGIVFLNGKLIDGIDGAGNPEVALGLFEAAILHELGHFSGLDHTQLHALKGFERADGSTVGDVTNTETMYPFIGRAEQGTLALDDRVALSLLYPSAGFAGAPGCLIGRVLRADGQPWTDANVVAYSLDFPDEAVSSVSGADGLASDAGQYALCGLTPGHDYRIEVQEIDVFASLASSVGPFDFPLPLPGPPEGWNGPYEGSDPALDDPTQTLAVTATSGTIASLDIRLNEQRFAVSNAVWVDDAVPSAPATAAPAGLVLGDFDHDSKLDMVSVERDFAPGNEIRFARGHGDGTFDPPVKIDSFPGNVALVAGQFNLAADSDLDIAVVSSSGDELRLYFGAGNGTFAPALTLEPAPANPSRPTLLAAGKLNGDAFADLLYLRSEADQSVTVLAFLGDGSGNFLRVASTIPSNLGITFSTVSSLVLGDFAGSPATDALVALPDLPGLAVLVGNGSGGFVASVQPLSSISSRLGTALAVADFDRDGRLDVAVPDYSPVGGAGNLAGSWIDILRNDPAQGFTLASRAAIGESLQGALVAADFDRDGLADILAAGSYLGAGEPGAKLSLVYGDGKAGIKPVQGPLGPQPVTAIWGLAEFPAALYPGELQAGDLNGDGRLDAVVSDHSTGVFGIADSFPSQISILLAQSLPFERPREYYTLAPCRLVDTRGTPPLVNDNPRTLQVTGTCGVPGTAKALSVNVTAISSTGAGNLVIYPGPLGPLPNTWTTSFARGVTRANNAVITLSPDGSGSFVVLPSVASGGSLHIAIDVNGYFQ
ncbi:MAG: VCBS repeat-containing protein [Acidobacteriota bacterium]